MAGVTSGQGRTARRRAPRSAASTAGRCSRRPRPSAPGRWPGRPPRRRDARVLARRRRDPVHPCSAARPTTSNSNSGGSYCPIPLPSRAAGRASATTADRHLHVHQPGAELHPDRDTHDRARLQLRHRQPGSRNPDVGQFAVVIASTTGAGCGTCSVLDAVIIALVGGTPPPPLNNGPMPVPCFIGAASTPASRAPTPAWCRRRRLAVRLLCVTGNPGCVQP